jgi:hypothetical protein
VEVCDPIVDCIAGPALEVDDDIGCTIDFCVESADFVSHLPNNLVCDNGLFCDGVEICDVLLDCQAGTPPMIDDGFQCTADSCDEGADVVVHVGDDASCNDGKDCTADSCDQVLGCVNAPIVGCANVPATTLPGRFILGVLLAGIAWVATRRTRRTSAR